MKPGTSRNKPTITIEYPVGVVTIVNGELEPFGNCTLDLLPEETYEFQVELVYGEGDVRNQTSPIRTLPASRKWSWPFTGVANGAVDVIATLFIDGMPKASQTKEATINDDSDNEQRVTPSISSLEPNTVDQDWEGNVQIRGSGFDAGSFSLFDGAVPPSTRRSDTLIEATVRSDITGTAGTKTVKVHAGGGAVSNEVAFVVSPKKK